VFLLSCVSDRMTLQFNTVGAWVGHCVLAPDSSSAERAAVIAVFVALAKALCELNNFHGSYAGETHRERCLGVALFFSFPSQCCAG